MATELKRNLLTVPGIGFALLPKLACPICWPVYASILTSLGLTFLMSAMYLFAFTAMFLLVALVSLSYRAHQRRGYRPFFLGFLASAGVLIGKFFHESNSVVYSGVTLLVVAAIWNAWPRRDPAIGCQQCSK